jgi:hypothetical protein
VISDNNTTIPPHVHVLQSFQHWLHSTDSEQWKAEVKVIRTQGGVGGGRNSRGPATIALGLINTNANDILLRPFAKYSVIKVWKSTTGGRTMRKKEQRNRLEHYPERIGVRVGTHTHTHSPTETWQCMWTSGTRSDGNTDEENDAAILVQWEPVYDGVMNTVQFDLITAWPSLKSDMIRFLSPVYERVFTEERRYTLALLTLMNLAFNWPDRTYRVWTYRIHTYERGTSDVYAVYTAPAPSFPLYSQNSGLIRDLAVAV